MPCRREAERNSIVRRAAARLRRYCTTSDLTGAAPPTPISTRLNGPVPFARLAVLCSLRSSRQHSAASANLRRLFLYLPLSLCCLPLLQACINDTHFTALVPSTQPIHILYDDDCDQDIDCVTTQPLLHHWINVGFIRIWGMVSSAATRQGAPTLQIFQNYYNHGGLYPIGAWSPACDSADSAPPFVALVRRFHPGDGCTHYPDCALLLRKAIVSYANSGKSSNGLTYIITGPLRCEEELRNSLPDSISPLSGADMERKYIRQFVVMNGYASSGMEYNCYSAPAACQAFFANVTKQNGFPPVFVVPLNTGASGIITQVPVSSLPEANPSAYALRVQGGIASTVDEDPLTVEFAVLGSVGWNVGPSATNMVNTASGANTWIGRDSGQFCLKLNYPADFFNAQLSFPWLSPSSSR